MFKWVTGQERSDTEKERGEKKEKKAQKCSEPCQTILEIQNILFNESGEFRRESKY